MTDGATQLILGMMVGTMIANLLWTILGVNALHRANLNLIEINERLKLLLERKGREEEL
jgi:hypothetical protein